MLVAADDSFESDFLAALRDGIVAHSSSAVFELVYFPLILVADFLLVRQSQVRVLRCGAPGAACSDVVSTAERSHGWTQKDSFHCALVQNRWA